MVPMFAPTSKRCSGRHPDAYRALGYAALDTSVHPWRGQLVRVLSPLLSPAIAATSAALEWHWLPFALRRFAVRALSGASYLLGTSEPGATMGK